MDQIEKYRKIIIGKKITVMVFMWILIFAGFFTYIFKVNEISTKGFKVTELQKNVKNLEEENKKLTLELSEMKKMANLDSFSKDQKMVKVDKIDYLSTKSSVAINK